MVEACGRKCLIDAGRGGHRLRFYRPAQVLTVAERISVAERPYGRRAKWRSQGT